MIVYFTVETRQCLISTVKKCLAEIKKRRQGDALSLQNPELQVNIESEFIGKIIPRGR